MLRCEQHNFRLVTVQFVRIHPSMSVRQFSMSESDCAFTASSFGLNGKKVHPEVSSNDENPTGKQKFRRCGRKHGYNECPTWGKTLEK